jgi:hypothetical protein
MLIQLFECNAAVPSSHCLTPNENVDIFPIVISLNSEKTIDLNPEGCVFLNNIIFLKLF